MQTSCSAPLRKATANARQNADRKDDLPNTHGKHSSQLQHPCLRAPCQLLSVAGPEHGRTILVDDFRAFLHPASIPQY
jgi:hypothetical protein